MSSDDRPKVTQTDYLGDKGVRMVDNKVSDELRWIFRGVPKRDIGIDGEIEKVSEDKTGTGRVIGVQVKCGPSFFEESTDESFVFRGEKKHYKYWIEHSLPVIIVLCNPESGECYWEEVTSANSEVLEKGWKIHVPKKNLLGAASKFDLSRIVERPGHKDIVRALLYQFLHEKYPQQIVICTMFEAPRDYHKFIHLSKIKGELVMIDLHHDLYGQIRVEDFEEIIKYQDYNHRVCGSHKLHIYVSSESEKALKFSKEVCAYLKKQKGVEVFRLIYTRDHFFGLDEIDEHGNRIEYLFSELHSDTESPQVTTG